MHWTYFSTNFRTTNNVFREETTKNKFEMKIRKTKNKIISDSLNGKISNLKNNLFQGEISSKSNVFLREYK